MSKNLAFRHCVGADAGAGTGVSTISALAHFLAIVEEPIRRIDRYDSHMTPTKDKRVDRWRQLLSNPADYQISRIEVVESNVFASQTIDLSRMTAIVGPHGSGKTHLLRMIDAAFGYESNTSTPPFSADSHYLHKEATSGLSGKLRVTVCHNNQTITRDINLSDSRSQRAESWNDAFPDPFGTWYARAHEAFSDLQMYYQENYYVHSQLESKKTEVLQYSAEDLRGLTNILFKSYDKVEVHTVFTDSGEYETGSEMPHVLGEIGGRKFDLTMMSSGEIWVHFLLGWHTHRAAHEPVLIDEPESFLAARGHRSLVDEIARRSLRQNNQVILATHSADILSRFPTENTRICLPGPSGVQVVTADSYVHIRDSIGLETNVRAVVLVEDEFARRVLLQICTLLDPTLPREIDIVISCGQSEVISGVRALLNSEKIPHVGVLDGDARGQSSKTIGDRCFYLPGQGSPEAELSMVASTYPDTVGFRLGRSKIDIQSALAACYGIDHQYWPSRFARQLGHDEGAVLHALVSVWLSDDKPNHEASLTLQGIRSFVDKDRR